MVLRAWILTAVSLLETMYLKVQQLIMVQQIPAGTSLCQCELSSTLQGNLLNKLTNVWLLKWSIFWTTGMCYGNAKCCHNAGMSGFLVNTPAAVLSSLNHVWNVSMFTQINITSFPFWNILDLRTYCLQPIICHSLLTIIIFVLQTYTRRCEKHICGNFWWGNSFIVLAFFIVPSTKCQ